MKSNKQINLSVKIGELVLKNPFILGSFDGLDSFCGLRRGYELSAGGFGAMVTKTATLQRREGYKRPRVAKFGSGYLVASGMKNFGIKKLSKEIRRFKNEYPRQVLFGSVASLNLTKAIEEIKYLGLEVARSGADAVELNLSCPHPNKKERFETSVVAQDPILVQKIIFELRRHLRKNNYILPIIPKLTGWQCDLGAVCLAAERGGADAVLVSNLFPGSGFYTGLRKINNKFKYKIGQHLVGNKRGGFTGPALHSAVLLMIENIRSMIKIPIIATGGCATDIDSIVQTFFAGASAIEAVTPFYCDDGRTGDCRRALSNYEKQLVAYMKKHNIRRLTDFYGLIKD